MPQEPIKFTSIADAIDTLRIYEKNFTYPYRKISKKQVISSSVTSNVFRAFKKLNKKPSQIYREWAHANFDGIYTDFKTINSSEEYYKFLYFYGDLLIDEWAKHTKNPSKYLVYGPAVKMINLLMKIIQQSEEYCIKDKMSFLQVPFDYYSLKPLKDIINELTAVNYKIQIPENPTMSFINTPQLYRIMMDSIYKLCEQIPIDPILYDYWCWDETHKVIVKEKLNTKASVLLVKPA